jgi:glycosyltransferase involved in cell wall biosynthesis
MSLCLLESLAYKNALLCSDIPENTSVAEDKAIYFEKGNVTDLSKKLQELCDDKNLVEKYRDGVDEFILSKYSWQDVAEKTFELYKK